MCEIQSSINVKSKPKTTRGGRTPWTATNLLQQVLDFHEGMEWKSQEAGGDIWLTLLKDRAMSLSVCIFSTNLPGGTPEGLLNYLLQWDEILVPNYQTEIRDHPGPFLSETQELLCLLMKKYWNPVWGTPNHKCVLCKPAADWYTHQRNLKVDLRKQIQKNASIASSHIPITLGKALQFSVIEGSSFQNGKRKLVS